MPLLEAVLTFLGRAEGLKAGLLRAYRGEEPQPAVAQASPALQRKAEAKPGEAWTRYYRGTAPQGGQGIAFDLKIHRAPDGRLSALYRVTPGSGITWRMTGAVLPNGSFYLERTDHGALVRGRYQNDNTLLVDYVRIVDERDPSPKPDDRKDLVFDNLVLEPSSDPLIEGASATGIEQTPRGTNLIQEIQTEPFVEAEDATRKRQESSDKPDDLDQLMGFKRKTPRYSVDQIQEARRRISLVKDEIERGNLYLLLQTKVIYRNQRDNNSTENGSKIGWKMCNLTSLAMALEVLGIKNPDQKKQFEDALEDYGRKNIRYWNRESPGNNGWKGLAESLYVKIDGQRYDVSVKFLLNPGANSRMPQDWWETTVLPELKSGNSIIMSVRGHIVRLQGMNNVGLVVDDPNGLADLSTYGGSDPITAMYSTNKERTNYANANAKEGSVGEGAKGEDNVWPWRSVVNHKWWWVAVLSLVKSN
ncbi:C39 family peptidase [Calidithermus terrae]|nr:C39 family peptidase [Calidithermus terrae]